MPFTKDYELFLKMSNLGKVLVELHCLKSDKLDKPIVKFYGEDSSLVNKIIYNEKESRIYINEKQYFDKVSEDMWKYVIGSYKVLFKWLKDRRKHCLSTNEIQEFCQITTAISLTINLQNEIDELYPDVEKEVIPFKSLKNDLLSFE